ncbi:MAG: ATP-binding protein [Verrucomicrobiota bacterium]|nr:ATP-binding protein [Verrucomicrobiota bacterium]
MSFTNNKLFIGVPQDFLSNIEGGFQKIDLAPSEIIFREGDKGDCLYLIEDGQVKITKNTTGSSEQVLSVLQPNDFFGEMAVLDQKPRSATATTVSHCILWQISQAQFQAIIVNRYPEIAVNLISIIIDRIRSLDHLFIDEMMKSERLKLVGQMTGGIVHDFKNPMAAILMAAQIFEERSPDHELKKLARMMVDQISRMNAMTRELLDYCRGETKLDIKSVPIEGILNKTVELFTAEAAKRHIHFVLQSEPLPVISADDGKIERVIQNLVTNAFEAMPKGGQITINAGATLDSIKIQIADTGKGIPARNIAKIFEPFFTEGKQQGTGLGLSICKRIIEAHNGLISVDSHEGKGTTFTIQLPLVTTSCLAPLKTA